MSTSPIHEDLQEMLPAAALEALDQADLERVLAHVQHCVACSGLLEEYRTVTAGLGLLLPHQAMDPARSARVRARLLERARSMEAKAPRPPISSGLVQQPRKGMPLAGPWTGWAVAAGLAGVLLMHHAVHRPLNYGWLAAGGLMVVMIALGIYASIQRGRVAALEKRLDHLERRPDTTTSVD